MNRALTAVWLIALVGAASSGCCCAGPPGPRRIGPSPVDAGRDALFFFRPDVGLDAHRDARGDAHGDAPDLAVCSTSGRVGAHCRDDRCSTGLECTMLVSGDVQVIFELRQGELGPGETYATVQDPVDPSDVAPFNALSGGVCVQACDLGASIDGCGSCATCVDVLTQMPLVASMGGALLAFPSADAPFGPDTGICRLDCAYDPATRGSECPDDMTCDAFTGTCVEQCTSDTECNTVQGITAEGEIVTLVDDVHPASCNPSTGRCERAGTEGAQVGDPCASGDDCAPGFGLCIGGLCAELGCETVSCGDGGLCLGINDHSTLCIQGCLTDGDCGAASVCSPLPAPIGGFVGYCAPIAEP